MKENTSLQALMRPTEDLTVPTLVKQLRLGYPARTASQFTSQIKQRRTSELSVLILISLFYGL